MQQETQEKQAIKAQRVKSYFIEAARDIILKEGVENVSVRKVADQAGYTFTTLYNYFSDLNDLLQQVKAVMIQDVMMFMAGISPEKIYDLEDIKRLNRAYMRYYVERPHVFRFFYSYRLNLNEVSNPEPLDLSRHYLETYRGFVLSGTLSEEDVPLIAKTIIYAIQGLLALYFSDNGMSEIRYEEIDAITEFLLKGRKQK